MAQNVNSKDFACTGQSSFRLSDLPTEISPQYESKKDYRKQLRAFQESTNELQETMYAHDRHAMLIIFQAMDAAGKDGTIRAVMSGVNPHGITVHPFKRPSSEELDHGFLWRTNKAMPQRGRIGIFNRSYYEEVLVARVHPEIVTDYQKLPVSNTENLKEVWKSRYEAIRNSEEYLTENGTSVVKFFLNVSKEEQKNRFLSRIDEPEKNWKFSDADVKERGFWNDYMKAYEDCINATSTKACPWYIIPADDKKNMRLIVSGIINDRLSALDMHYPKVSKERQAELQEVRSHLADS